MPSESYCDISVAGHEYSASISKDDLGLWRWQIMRDDELLVCGISAHTGRGPAKEEVECRLDAEC